MWSLLTKARAYAIAAIAVLCSFLKTNQAACYLALKTVPEASLPLNVLRSLFSDANATLALLKSYSFLHLSFLDAKSDRLWKKIALS